MTKNKGSQRRKIMKVALIASDNNASSGAFLSMTNLAIQLNQLHVKTIVIIPKEGPYVGPGDKKTQNQILCGSIHIRSCIM